MGYTSVEKIEFVYRGRRSEFDEDDKEALKHIMETYTDPIIDSHLDEIYEVPFDSYPDTPKIITSISTWITAYLFQVLPSQTSSQEWIETLWERALKFLEALAEEEMTIPEADKIIEEEGIIKVYERVQSESNVGNLLLSDSDFSQKVFGDSEATIRG